jgi:V-type H+-transporting ATPase proteolipid subunit
MSAELLTLWNAVKPVDYSLFAGFVHLGAGLACGFTGMAAGYAIGIIGDSVRRLCNPL